MSTIALQPTQVFNRPFHSTRRSLQNKERVPDIERRQPKYVTIPADSERRLKSIAFLTQYMEDLKAGRPVENISPSNDPFYLVPEHIAQMIDSEKSLLSGNVKGRVIESVDDLWKDLGIE